MRFWIPPSSNPASEQARDLVRESIPCFEYRESFETIFRSLSLTWKSWTGWMGCRRSRSTSRSEILSQLLRMLETWFCWQNQCFGAWGIIWDYFQKPQIDLKATNRVEGLKEVKKHFKEWNSISASEHARDMVLVAKPMFCCMGNHLGLFSEASDWPEGHKQGGGTERGQEALQGVKFYLSFWAC